MNAEGEYDFVNDHSDRLKVSAHMYKEGPSVLLRMFNPDAAPDAPEQVGFVRMSYRNALWLSSALADLAAVCAAASVPQAQVNTSSSPAGGVLR